MVIAASSASPLELLRFQMLVSASTNIDWTEAILLGQLRQIEAFVSAAGRDFLVESFCTLIVKDDQIGVEGKDIRLHRTNQELRGVAADGTIFDAQIRSHKFCPQICRHLAPPVLFGDRLAEEQDTYCFRTVSRTGSKTRHISFDAASGSGHLGVCQCSTKQHAWFRKRRGRPPGSKTGTASSLPHTKYSRVAVESDVAI